MYAEDEKEVWNQAKELSRVLKPNSRALIVVEPTLRAKTPPPVGLNPNEALEFNRRINAQKRLEQKLTNKYRIQKPELAKAHFIVDLPAILKDASLMILDRRPSEGGIQIEDEVCLELLKI